MGEEFKLKSLKKYEDFPVVIPPTHQSKVKIVYKKNNCNVDGLNGFTEQWIGRYFKFNIHSVRMSSTVNKGEKKNDLKKPEMTKCRTRYVSGSRTKIIVNQKHFL